MFGLNYRESSAIVNSTKCTVIKIPVDEYRRLMNHMDAVEQNIVLQVTFLIKPRVKVNSQSGRVSSDNKNTK